LVPSSEIWPEATGTIPLIALMSDDFPAPFGPTRATISPRSTCRLTSSTAVAVPYLITTLLNVSMGRSKVGVDDVLVLTDFVGRPFSNNFAQVKHGNAVG